MTTHTAFAASLATTIAADLDTAIAALPTTVRLTEDELATMRAEAMTWCLSEHEPAHPYCAQRAIDCVEHDTMVAWENQGLAYPSDPYGYDHEDAMADEAAVARDEADADWTYSCMNDRS